MKPAQFVFLGLLCTTPFVRDSSAAVFLDKYGPTFANEQTIDFGGYPVGTVANLLFQNQGFTFSRDDGNEITIADGTISGILPTYDNSLWTGVSPPNEGSLEIQSSTPLYAIGFSIGSNGSGAQSILPVLLTAFDSSDHLLGSVTSDILFPIAPFKWAIAIKSNTAFSRVRIDSPLGPGTTAALPFFLDDLKFSSVPIAIPEPRSLTLVWLGLLLMLILKATKVFRPKNRFHTILSPK